MAKQSRRTTKYKGAEEEGMAKVISLLPMNDNQKAYIDALKSYNQVVVCGFSGTGKSYIAATYAANLYAMGQIDKIIITRPNVSVGKDLGYLPGEINEKYAPWVAPVLDVLKEQLGNGTVETAIKNGNIEMAPLSTMRGRSFHDAFIILDEASNTTIPEILMFLTRIGDNCKVVINGDIRQSDLKDRASSGLGKVIHLIKRHNLPVPVIEFGIDDIVRSDMTKMWVTIFTEEGLL